MCDRAYQMEGDNCTLPGLPANACLSDKGDSLNDALRYAKLFVEREKATGAE